MSNTEDHTYKNLKGLIKNESLCILFEDKNFALLLL